MKFFNWFSDSAKPLNFAVFQLIPDSHNWFSDSHNWFRILTTDSRILTTDSGFSQLIPGFSQLIPDSHNWFPQSYSKRVSVYSKSSFHIKFLFELLVIYRFLKFARKIGSVCELSPTVHGDRNNEKRCIISSNFSSLPEKIGSDWNIETEFTPTPHFSVWNVAWFCIVSFQAYYTPETNEFRRIFRFCGLSLWENQS